MNNETIIIRKVNENDAYNWFLLVNKVWRYAYKDIFPEEVFIDRDNKIEQKVKTFSDIMKNSTSGSILRRMEAKRCLLSLNQMIRSRKLLSITLCSMP